MLQRRIDIIPSTVNWQFTVVYVDSVVILSTYVEEHLDHPRTVLGLLLRASVSFILKKCFIFEECIYYCCHLIQPGRLFISKNAADAIGRLQPLLTLLNSGCFRVSKTYFHGLYRSLHTFPHGSDTS